MLYFLSLRIEPYGYVNHNRNCTQMHISTLPFPPFPPLCLVIELHSYLLSFHVIRQWSSLGQCSKPLDTVTLASNGYISLINALISSELYLASKLSFGTFSLCILPVPFSFDCPIIRITVRPFYLSFARYALPFTLFHHLCSSIVLLVHPSIRLSYLASHLAQALCPPFVKIILSTSYPDL